MYTGRKCQRMWILHDNTTSRCHRKRLPRQPLKMLSARFQIVDIARMRSVHEFVSGTLTAGMNTQVERSWPPLFADHNSDWCEDVFLLADLVFWCEGDKDIVDLSEIVILKKPAGGCRERRAVKTTGKLTILIVGLWLIVKIGTYNTGTRFSVSVGKIDFEKTYDTKHIFSVPVGQTRLWDITLSWHTSPLINRARSLLDLIDCTSWRQSSQKGECETLRSFIWTKVCSNLILDLKRQCTSTLNLEYMWIKWFSAEPRVLLLRKGLTQYSQTPYVQTLVTARS